MVVTTGIVTKGMTSCVMCTECDPRRFVSFLGPRRVGLKKGTRGTGSIYLTTYKHRAHESSQGVGHLPAAAAAQCVELYSVNLLMP